MAECISCGTGDFTLMTEYVDASYGGNRVQLLKQFHGCSACGFSTELAEDRVLNEATHTLSCNMWGPCTSPDISVDPFSAGAYMNWSWKGKGFGQLSFSLKDGKYECQNEGLSVESVRALLHTLADHIADNIVLEK